ncbi:MAG: hypothetical protein HC866_10255 [Leptolyngbyaceae cyanobacterium RU_5_1]|nr:hypothetical protein [Leptolyngbyaceae cyanobacterium RU_5_1]
MKSQRIFVGKLNKNFQYVIATISTNIKAAITQGNKEIQIALVNVSMAQSGFHGC